VNTNISYVNGSKCLAYEARFRGIDVGLETSEKAKSVDKVITIYWKAVETEKFRV